MVRSELMNEYLKVGIIGKIPIEKQNYDKLPVESRFSHDGYYYEIAELSLTPDEINSVIALKTLDSINTIKKICTFFLVLTIISVLITLFGYFKLTDFISGFSAAFN